MQVDPPVLKLRERRRTFQAKQAQRMMKRNAPVGLISTGQLIKVAIPLELRDELNAARYLIAIVVECLYSGQSVRAATSR